MAVDHKHTWVRLHPDRHLYQCLACQGLGYKTPPKRRNVIPIDTEFYKRNPKELERNIQDIERPYR